MRRNLRIALLITAALPLGCGSNPSPPTANYLDLTGNWEASAPPNPPNSSNFPTPIDAFIGALQSSGGTVTGTLRAFDLNFSSPCVSSTQDLAAAGTLDSTGNLVLTVPISEGLPPSRQPSAQICRR